MQSNIALCNLEAEQGLLGSILIDPFQFERVNEVMKAEFFFAPAHQRIYQEIERSIFSGKKPSIVLLKDMLKAEESNPEFEAFGGVSSYLVDLAGGVISSTNALDYARHIADLHLRRSASSKLQEYSTRLLSFHENIPSEILLDEAENDIVSLRRKSEPNDSIDAEVGFQSALKWMEGIRNGVIKRVSTGYESLDKYLGGLYPGFLYILAARPSMGKTALALNIAENVSSDGHVLFFSLEMTTQELTMRLAARQTSIPIDLQMRSENLTDDQFRRICEVKIPKTLRVDDRSGLAVEQIRSRARAFARGANIKAIIIDHLGLVEPDHKMQMVHAIGKITKGIKELAKDLDVPAILLCQLSRAVESRDDKRPMLSDLRDSGTIEQDANVVMFLYREEYYFDKSDPPRKKEEKQDAYNVRLAEHQDRIMRMKGKAEVIIAKNRAGKCGSTLLNFSGIRQEFSEI